MSLDLVIVLIIILAAIPANLFLILYTLWTNWWDDKDSRHLFFFMAGLAGLIDLALIRRVTGPFIGYEFLAIGVYLVICSQLWRRLFLLIKFNKHPLREKRQSHDAV